MMIKQWTGADDNRWEPVGATTSALPPGFYHFLMEDGMFGERSFLSKFVPAHDCAVLIKDAVSDYCIKQLTKFRASHADYARFKMLHKRGIMLAGPAGSGKTMAATLAGEHVVSNGGIVVQPFSPHYFGGLPDMLRWIRHIHPDMFIMCLLEDIDSRPYQDMVEKHLALLDGHLQIDNCFFMATTNHMDEVDERLTNRPKRYDEVIYVGAPSESSRRSYLDQIIPQDQPNRQAAIDELAKVSEGLMLAHLADLMISHLLLGHTVQDAATRLQKMNAPSDDEIVNGEKSMVLQLAVPSSAIAAAAKKSNKRR